MCDRCNTAFAKTIVKFVSVVRRTTINKKSIKNGNIWYQKGIKISEKKLVNLSYLQHIFRVVVSSVQNPEIINQFSYKINKLSKI